MLADCTREQHLQTKGRRPYLMTTGALLALVSVSLCVGPQLGFGAQCCRSVCACAHLTAGSLCSSAQVIPSPQSALPDPTRSFRCLPLVASSSSSDLTHRVRLRMQEQPLQGSSGALHPKTMSQTRHHIAWLVRIGYVFSLQASLLMATALLLLSRHNFTKAGRACDLLENRGACGQSQARGTVFDAGRSVKAAGGLSIARQLSTCSDTGSETRRVFPSNFRSFCS